jgi:hypothetical protein
MVVLKDRDKDKLVVVKAVQVILVILKQIMTRDIRMHLMT